MDKITNEPAVPYELANAPAPEPERFTIGDLTHERVFKAAGLTNLSDMQAVLDAVEAALQPPSPPQGIVKRTITAVLHDACMVHIDGKDCLFGHVEADSSGRFKDGSIIKTSPIKERWRDIVWTENSCYYIASERVDPGSGKLSALVQRLSLILKKYGDLWVETPGGEMTELQLFNEAGGPCIGEEGDKVAGVLIQ